jgi:hypothetical protein
MRPVKKDLAVHELEMRDRNLPERVLPSHCPWPPSGLPEVGKPLPQGGGEGKDYREGMGINIAVREA